MQHFVRNPYDLHIEITSILLLKWKPYSPGIHCEGEPAQEVLILCLRVTWLSEGTGCCNLSLHNLPHRAFPPWSKVSFHLSTQSWSLPDSTQHIHPPKKSQGNSGSGTEWAPDGEQALSLSDIPASIFTRPGRAVRKDLYCLKCPNMAWQNLKSNSTKNDRDSLEWGEGSKIFQNHHFVIQHVVVERLSCALYLVINVTCIMSL